jgi:hypothetical protein
VTLRWGRFAFGAQTHGRNTAFFPSATNTTLASHCIDGQILPCVTAGKASDPKTATLSIWVSAIDLPFGWMVKAAGLSDPATRERSVSRAAQIQRALHAFSDSIVDRDDLPDTYHRDFCK